jgi:hypothetical protein
MLARGMTIIFVSDLRDASGRIALEATAVIPADPTI